MRMIYGHVAQLD